MSTQTDKKKIKIDNGSTFGKVYTDVASDAKYATQVNLEALQDKVSDIVNDLGNYQEKLTAGVNVVLSNNTISVPDIPTAIKLNSDFGLALYNGNTDLSDSYVYLDSNTFETYTKNGNTYIACSVSVDAYTKTESDTKYATKTELSNQKSTLEDEISLKQDTLTAGDGISISNNVISATSSGGCEIIIRSW